MDRDGLQNIEEALGITLPVDYSKLVMNRGSTGIDNTSLIDDPKLIIKLTKEYRGGFGGVPEWPSCFIYIGDEDDACPYALDCITGIIVQTDHGNLELAPLTRYESVAEFASALELSS
jgi:hypothetical protein